MIRRLVDLNINTGEIKVSLFKFLEQLWQADLWILLSRDHWFDILHPDSHLESCVQFANQFAKRNIGIFLVIHCQFLAISLELNGHNLNGGTYFQLGTDCLGHHKGLAFRDCLVAKHVVHVFVIRSDDGQDLADGFVVATIRWGLSCCLLSLAVS
jgi:hypothetical protein